MECDKRRPVAALDELAACLDSAHQALQALQTLLDLAADGDADGTVQVTGLAALMQGPQGQLAQAHEALQLLRRQPVPRCPPAPAPPCGPSCWHDAQGLVQGT
jgi:hypothetical protein